MLRVGSTLSRARKDQIVRLRISIKGSGRPASCHRVAPSLPLRINFGLLKLIPSLAIVVLSSTSDGIQRLKLNIEVEELEGNDREAGSSASQREHELIEIASLMRWRPGGLSRMAAPAKVTEHVV